MKIYVYAICKNEEKFVNRWVESMSEADGIYVLDTGSTDKTVEILQNLGVCVFKQIINPWRFDVARNISLSKVPLDADFCVSTDLDDVFEKGWRSKIESLVKPNVKQIKYPYVWSVSDSGKDVGVLYTDKIHTRKNFIWVEPVHEVLCYVGDNYLSQTVNVTIRHFPDKTKSREQYLKLLELAVSENSNNARNLHYLGREYTYYYRHDDAIKILKKHLKLKSSKWVEERAASMRYIGLSYRRKKDFVQSEYWLLKALSLTPNVREPYVYLAELYYDTNNYVKLLNICEKALKITKPSITYISEPNSFNHTLYDFAAIAAYQLNKYSLAYSFINEAIRLSPDNERLKNNKKIIKDKI